MDADTNKDGVVDFVELAAFFSKRSSSMKMESKGKGQSKKKKKKKKEPSKQQDSLEAQVAWIHACILIYVGAG